MTLLLIYATVALGISFVCSILEAVFFSVTPSYIAALQEEGDPIGAQLKALKEDVDRPLAAILSLNTIATTVGPVGVGAQAQLLWGDASIGVVSAVLSLAILYITEIVPKTMGTTYWRHLAPGVARALPIAIVLTYPLVWVATRLMSLLTFEQEPQPQVSREEMNAMTELGVREGVVEPGESVLLRNILRFGELSVKDVMTPRTVLHSAPESLTAKEYFERYPEPIFSRIPVYDEESENITGYVLKSDLLLEMARDRLSTTLDAHRRDALFVPENRSLRTLFEQLISEQHHIAVVVDEYGGIVGVVTMEDVVETLLGLEIVDESDVEQDMRALARSRWMQRARRMGLPLDAFQTPVPGARRGEG